MRRAFSRVPILLLMVSCAVLAACKPAASDSQSVSSPIKIGEIASLTGREAGLGQYTHMGVQLALEEINAHGGVLGRMVELVSEDSRSKAGETATATRKLISRDQVVAMIGEGASGRCLEGAPIAQQAGIPVISPTATNPKVTEVGDCIFRVCFTDPFQGTVMATFARKSLKIQRVGLLVDVAAPYSVGLAEFFKQRFTADGGQIVAQQKFTGGDKDFLAQLTSLKAAKPEAIFAPSYYGEGGLILLQARRLGLEIPMLGGDGWEAPELVQTGGKAADGSFFPVHFSLESTDPRSREFIRAFEARWQKPPTGASALGYDALMVLIDAIRRAGSSEPAKIKAALATTKDHPGVTGFITLDEGRNARKPAAIIQVRDGRFQFVETVAP